MTWTFDVVTSTWRCNYPRPELGATAPPEAYLIQGYFSESGQCRFVPKYIIGKSHDFKAMYIITWARPTLKEAKDDCETHVVNIAL